MDPDPGGVAHHRTSKIQNVEWTMNDHIFHMPLPYAIFDYHFVMIPFRGAGTYANTKPIQGWFFILSWLLVQASLTRTDIK